MPAALRPARASDIDALVAIERAAFSGDRISRRSFRQLIERETARTIVAEKAGEPVGYCMILFRKNGGVARLYSIATMPEKAGAGVGGLLLAAAEDAAFDKNRMLLRLEVREGNSRAVRWYEKSGYRRIGREKGYYEDGSPALRYEKVLRGDVPAPPSSSPNGTPEP